MGAQHAFANLCRQSAIATLDELSNAIERARVTVHDDAAIAQPDLRDSAEAAINALQSLEATRRFIANPIVHGEPLADRRYDQGAELAIAPLTHVAPTPGIYVGARNG